MKNLDPRFFITFARMALDSLVIFFVYLFSYFFYLKGLNKASPQSATEFIWISGVISALYIIIADRIGLYRRDTGLMSVRDLSEILKVNFWAAGIILASSFYWHYAKFSRITLTAAFILAPIALFMERRAFSKGMGKIHRRGWARKGIVIFGAGEVGKHLARRMLGDPSLGLLPLGFLDDNSEKHGQLLNLNNTHPLLRLRVLGGDEQIPGIRRLGAKGLFICLPSASFHRNQRLVEQCIENSIDYAIVPNAYEKFIQNVEMFEIGGIPILRRKTQRTGPIYLALKRITDFIVGLVLILVLLPLFFFIGIAIKLESGGPILFKQKRVGERGREFSFYKFRSMYVECPRYALTPSDPNDPRITRVGKWLRRTSLDELPQLFNVLRGDMSMVGPRPEMPFIVAQYSPLHRKRLEAKPGITGIWQISAARAAPIHHNIEYDLFYLENRSTLLDLAILIHTTISVIRGIGAV